MEEKMYVGNRKNDKTKRINFTISQSLNVKAEKIARDMNVSISNLLRRALEKYIAENEQEKIDLELSEGYKANYEYYSNSQKEWRFADSLE